MTAAVSSASWIRPPPGAWSCGSRSSWVRTSSWVRDLGFLGPDLGRFRRLGALADVHYRRSMRMTSTIMMIRTTVPIPIYIGFSFS